MVASLSTLTGANDQEYINYVLLQRQTAWVLQDAADVTKPDISFDGGGSRVLVCQRCAPVQVGRQSAMRPCAAFWAQHSRLSAGRLHGAACAASISRRGEGVDHATALELLRHLATIDPTLCKPMIDAPVASTTLALLIKYVHANDTSKRTVTAQGTFCAQLWEAALARTGALLHVFSLLKALALDAGGVFAAIKRSFITLLKNSRVARRDSAADCQGQ